ncbi:MAG: HupE/UreJ family protein [Epsilonproteobacteria bacterium]|nr:MAG: HupE/UreJ family protein [Campylobacterota bacterium]
MKIITSLLLMFIYCTFSMADEIKLSYLEIKEIKTQHYSVLLKLASTDNQKLPINMLMPKECSLTLPKTSHLVNSTYLDRWQMKCTESLADKTLFIEGLKSTGTDLLLRLELLSGVSHSKLLSSSTASYRIPKDASSWQIVQTYSWLGITHILLGFDHLLFIFALLLIVKNMRRLLWTITAFTLAHSLTMVVATLGIIHLPSAPVEAIIALSILFLAMEIIHEKQGKRGITSRYPWIIAFIFGLLHGFGFAGALAEIGLPQQAITLALIFFNIGVELGQLLFVATIVFIVVMLQRLSAPALLNKLQTTVVYMIGGISSFWLIERILSF